MHYILILKIPLGLKELNPFPNQKIRPIKILDNIIVAKAYSSSHHELILSESSKVIDSYNIKLLVIDSIISLYRSNLLDCLHFLKDNND